MEWIPAPTPINENRRAQAVAKTGIIDTDQVKLFDIYCEIAKDLTGYEGAVFSLFDAKEQCVISEIGTGSTEMHRKGDKAESICSYVLLETSPLLVFDIAAHDTFKNHPNVKAGLCKSYSGFPVLNKENYALGTFCLLNFSEIKEISSEKILLIEKLISRAAHQIDTQTEQKELTSQKISNSIDVFSENNTDASLSDFKHFIDLCSGLPLSDKAASELLRNDLCVRDNGSLILSSKGNDLQEKMGLQTKILNKIKIEGDAANKMVDSMLDKLGAL